MQTHQILIVDKDMAAAFVTKSGIERMLGTNAIVHIAQSPGSAWLQYGQKSINTLIIDPSTWSHAAISLITALQRLHPDLPVIVLTAYDTPRLRRDMQSLGVTHYLAKPIELAELAQYVREVLQ
jgi:DNA-binding NarL/FixJ family response regulator